MKSRLMGAALAAVAAVSIGVAAPIAAQASPASSNPSTTAAQGDVSAQAGWVTIGSYSTAAACDAARAGLSEPALCDRQVTDHGNAIWYLKVYRW